jgi:hypothetical protein
MNDRLKSVCDVAGVIARQHEVACEADHTVIFCFENVMSPGAT